MPVLSLHNTYSLPSGGSASYSLGLSGAPVGASHTYGGGQSSVLGATTAGLGNLSLSSTLPGNLGGYNSSSYSTYTNPLLASGALSMKLKPLDEIDLGLGHRYSSSGANRGGTPLSPIPTNSWMLDSYGAGGVGGLDGVNPTFMHTSGIQRPLSRLGGLDLDGEYESGCHPLLKCHALNWFPLVENSI